MPRRQFEYKVKLQVAPQLGSPFNLDVLCAGAVSLSLHNYFITHATCVSDAGGVAVADGICDCALQVQPCENSLVSAALA
jgi:hypothetical protein